MYLRPQVAAMSHLKQLISEIHRRSLWQVLLIYCGAALVAYQAVQALTEGLGLPQWFPALAIVLFIVGLPVVLATAFVQEVGPPTVAPAEPTALTEAEEAEAAAVHLQARRRHRFLTWRNAGATFVIVLAAWGVVATGWLLFGRADESATTDERPSVAVLPLENRSGLEEDQYFTDGIHDEILTQLSRISGLSVRGRTSVMEYRDSPKNLRQVGEELNARYLMEGGVQRAGETVRINVQLIDADTDEHVFVETYDRALSVENLLAVQREVALRIADALEATLTPAEREGIEARPTESSKAYDFYLRGNEYARRQYDPADLLVSVRMYQRAIELDPAFAVAYAALARVQGWRSWYYGVAEALPEAREMLERARQLDPDLPEFHMTQGIFHYRQREYSRAMQNFTRTQELQPNNGEAISYMGFVRRRQGRWNEAIIRQQEALQLDPRNHVWMYDLGESYADTRQYAEAEVYYNRAIALAPDVAEYYVAKALQRLLWKGNTDQAIEVIHEGFEAAGHLEVISHVVNVPNVGTHYQPLMRVNRPGYFEDLFT
jgi:TolB-like protein